MDQSHLLLRPPGALREVLGLLFARDLIALYILLTAAFASLLYFSFR